MLFRAKTPSERRRGRGQPASSDAGFSLPEVLVSATVMATLFATISLAFSVVARAEKPTNTRISESKDIGFLQTYLPTDLSSAASESFSPTYQPIAGMTLPGTNIATFTQVGIGDVVISYRYVQRGSEWLVQRFEVTNPDAPNRDVSINTLAHETKVPPPGWSADQTPSHAAAITLRNPDVKPVGIDITVTFESGNQIVLGGTGLSSGDELTAYQPGVLPDPQAPRSRCGGRIALVVDSSGSVPNQGGGRALEDAAVSFINGFRGTPSEMTVVGFDYRAYQMAPAGATGQYFDLLEDNTAADTAANRILQLDDVDNAFYTTDPNGDGVHWNQTGAATNWEDGLWRVLRNDNGVLHEKTPELVVFITDGSPNVNRTSTAIDSFIEAADVSRAVDVANELRGNDARVVGILVGAVSSSTSAVNRLKQVTGNVQWDGTGPDNIGNANLADIFIPSAGSFSNLGPVLKAIAAAECGSNVTVRKQIEVNGSLTDPTGPWNYLSDVGTGTLDPSIDSSVTFDFSLPTGEFTRLVEIHEEPVDGYTLDRVECTSGGQPMAAGDVTQLPPDTPGVIVKVFANKAVACTFISRPT